jgi:hypothetical protein
VLRQYEPIGQKLGAVDPGAQKVPKGQILALAEDVPAGQYAPAGQGNAEVERAGQYVPAAQTVCTVGVGHIEPGVHASMMVLLAGQ